VNGNALMKLMVRKLVRSVWTGIVLAGDKGNWRDIVNTL